MISNAIKKFCSYFSVYPKYQPQANPKKFRPTIKKSQFVQKFNGYVLYESKQTKSIRIISYFFAFCITGSVIKHHFSSEIQKFNDKIIIGIMVASFIIHQWRISSTLKRVILDRRGQNLNLVRYGVFGHFERILQAPVQIMKGITSATKYGGNMIHGGGIYGYRAQNFWFHSSGIVNKQIFEAAVSGIRISIID